MVRHTNDAPYYLKKKIIEDLPIDISCDQLKSDLLDKFHSLFTQYKVLFSHISQHENKEEANFHTLEEFISECKSTSIRLYLFVDVQFRYIYFYST